MKKFLMTVSCLLSVFPALAAEELVVPEQECEYLTTYQPSADTAYQPGLDVHGKPVMEADITPSVIRPPEKYSFDISVDIAENIGLTVPAGIEGKTKIGTITVEKGQIKFNGTPLEGDAEAALKAICKAQKEKKQLPDAVRKLPPK